MKSSIINLISPWEVHSIGLTYEWHLHDGRHPMGKKTNIIFILSDQHNAKILGHKGHPDIKTPHLDKLAETGTRFDNAITQNPICTPSRVSFLSGQYAHNHGIYQLVGCLRSFETFIGNAIYGIICSKIIHNR